MDDITRLRFIKTNVILPKKNGQVRNLYNKDFEWLIEQAEKVERYEKALKEIAENQEDNSCNETAIKYEVIAEKALGI